MFSYVFYNAAGKTIRKGTGMMNTASMPVGALGKGLYFLEIRTKNGKAVHEVIVE